MNYIYEEHQQEGIDDWKEDAFNTRWVIKTHAFLQTQFQNIYYPLPVFVSSVHAYTDIYVVKTSIFSNSNSKFQLKIKWKSVEVLKASKKTF